VGDAADHPAGGLGSAGSWRELALVEDVEREHHDQGEPDEAEDEVAPEEVGQRAGIGAGPAS
jgi:hypothetical protein